MTTESFFLVAGMTGADRTYVHTSMTAERYKVIKRDHPKARIYKVLVELPDEGPTHDVELEVQAAEVKEATGV